MPKRAAKAKSSRRTRPPPATQRPRAAKQYWRSWALLLAPSALLFWIVSTNLHSNWIALPWLAAIALWGCVFWRSDPARESIAPFSRQFSVHFSIVLIVAFATRWFKISKLPLGPSADEIFTLNNTVELLHQPFDLFGHTPLFFQGWVETAHLYLYFNLLIIKLFGVSFWSMKLFSVVPGIIACAAVFLLGRLLFPERIAFWTGLLFAVAHWPVRLSRYGWDVSFEIMSFALALFSLMLALKHNRSFYAYLSGFAAGICLYSYLGARICVLSLLGFFLWQGFSDNGRAIIRHGAAFAAGLLLTAFPLLIYYFAHPVSFWIRITELSVFGSKEPFLTIFENVWSHALMFFVRGGVYARDNYPALPMLDPLTGFFFLAGLIVMYQGRGETRAKLLACTLFFNFAAGIFSVSQESAPYVYRTAAVVLPAFLISGYGLQRLMITVEKYLAPRLAGLLGGSVLLLTIAVNLYLYFGLEPNNRAAMRVIAYEPRVIGLEVARDDRSVFLMGRDLLSPVPFDLKTHEKYAATNPPVILPLPVRKLAVVSFSGRQDLDRSLSQNFAAPKNIHFVDGPTLSIQPMAFPASAKIIFRSVHHELKAAIQSTHPDATIKELHDLDGRPLWTVMLLAKPAARE